MKFRGHLCNENAIWQGTHKKETGSAFWAGRYWLYYKNHRDVFHLEWYLLHKANSSFAFKIEFGSGDGDDGIMFHAAIPKLFSIYFCINGIFGKLFHHPNESRETGISFHDGTIYFYPFAKVNSWATKDNWWSKYHSFLPYEFLCGRYKYSESDDSGWRPIVIPMPEKSYKGKIRLYLGNWKNRFITKRLQRAEIDLEEGIPYPGKGESSWDCGEDCSYGLTCCAKTPEKAIAEMVEHVLYRRRNYGCYNSMLAYTPKTTYLRSTIKSADGMGLKSVDTAQAT